MSESSLAQKLRAALPALKLTEGEPMRAHCSFRIGGPAEVFAEPGSEAELIALLRALRSAGAPYAVVGNGTNLLVGDGGVSGCVIRIGAGLDGLRREGNAVAAGAGALLSRCAVFARDAGLAGLEFAHGIPGSLGGAVMMNAGAYGGELKDVVKRVRYLDRELQLRETEDGGFSYRHSRFEGSGEIILGAELSLTPDDPEAIHARMMELWARRSASQPLDQPSAGSTFKRPAQGYAAAMIDGAGLKGLRVGGAQVSEKHAGFVVNTGGATCADVTALMEHIQAAVFEKYGVRLEPEVRFL